MILLEDCIEGVSHLQNSSSPVESNHGLLDHLRIKFEYGSQHFDIAFQSFRKFLSLVLNSEILVTLEFLQARMESSLKQTHIKLSRTLQGMQNRRTDSWKTLSPPP